jgi:hypothetical protein
MDPLEAERAHNARSTMDSIRRLAEYMQGVRGRRKAMVLVSEGISYDVYDAITRASANVVTQDTRDAIAASTRANVAIYAIDPRGLGAFDEAIEAGGVSADDAGNSSVVRGLLDAARLSQESLRVLANETGGYAAVNRNDFTDAFARIVRENSTYYVMGYYPTNERRDGRFRRLEVRVKRPGLQVRSRRGYVAARGRPPQPRTVATDRNPVMNAASEALSSPLPVSGIPMNVFAAAYKGAAPNASVALTIEMRVDDFRFTEKDGTFNDTVGISFTSVDAAGKTYGSDRQILTMAMKPDSVAAARARGFRVVSQFDVPPGRYQLRVATAEEGANRTGSVIYDLDVPDFYKPRLAMSGVTLTSAMEATKPTVLHKSPLGDVLPGPPTAAREFQAGDTIVLFAEFYENVANAPPHTLDLSTTLSAEGGRVVFEDREERSSTDLQGKAGGYGYGVQVPLAGVASGVYVLHVEGRSRAGGAEAGVGRDVLIRVR